MVVSQTFLRILPVARQIGSMAGGHATEAHGIYSASVPDGAM